jgi:aerobic carbon-monoxide dehydrogenase small subunit
MINNIRFHLNDKLIEINTHPLRRLLDVLREDCGLLGSKEGCGEGECGACSVFVDGELVNSCLFPIGKVDNKQVISIEGFRGTKRYEVLKESFEEAGAVQCGFCSPGMLMASEGLLRKHPHPTEQQIREGISGNLCRCTGYNMIVEAVTLASKRGDGLW